MRHLGNICNVHGYDIEPVDLITGGSPCQDLSVAGLRKGLKHEENGDDETTRSGLFIEQMRIVREMRERDRRTGRSGIAVRPRYMVWENVYGAFSSGKPKGADFAIVLEEIIKVCEPEASDFHVGIPDGGWPTAGCYYAEDGSWSVAYKTVDAQFWGTPQRRKRIALLADFNGPTAADILFDPQLRREAEEPEPDKAESDSGRRSSGTVSPIGKSMSGHPEQSGAERERTSEGTESSVGEPSVFGIDQQGGKGGANYTEGIAPTLASDSHGTPHAVSFQERAGKPGGGKGILIQEEHTDSLRQSYVQSVYSIQGNTIDRDAKQNGLGVDEDVSHTLNSTDRHGIMAFTQNQRDEVRDLGELAGSISAETGSHQQNYVMDDRVVIPIEGNGTRESHMGNGFGKPGDPSFTLNHVEQHKVAVGYAVDCRNGTESAEVNGTLQSKEQGFSYNLNNVVRVKTEQYAAGFSFGQSAKARSLGYEEEVSPTIRGGEGGNQKPVVLEVKANDENPEA